MSTQDDMLLLAALTWAQARIALAIDDTKARVAAEIGVGGRAVARVDGVDDDLGGLSYPKPSSPRPRIVDEELALSWLVENFGTDGMVRMRPTEQGTKTLIEAARKGAVPGVEVPAPGVSTPRFTPSKAADSVIPELIREGRLSLPRLIEVEP